MAKNKHREDAEIRLDDPNTKGLDGPNPLLSASQAQRNALSQVELMIWLRQYYERLRAAGKPGKVAVIAAMRKLLTAVWSVATHRKPFVPHLPSP